MLICFRVYGTNLHVSDELTDSFLVLFPRVLVAVQETLEWL